MAAVGVDNGTIMFALTELAGRRAAVVILAATLVAGGFISHNGLDPVSSSSSLAMAVTTTPAPTLTAPDDVDPPAEAVKPASAYLTKDLSKVVTRRALKVYSSPDFTATTGRRLKKGVKVTVKRVETTADGVPRLAIKGGYVSAERRDVKRPPLAKAKAREVYAFDLDSGKVLYKKNSSKPTSIASTAKIMTALILRDEIAAGNLSWDTKVKIKNQALVDMSVDWDAGGLPFKKGKSYTLRQLDRLSLVESHNAAVTQIGWKIAGSNEAFIDRINDKAAELGMKRSKFISISGLDNKSLVKFGLDLPGTSGGNRVSAADLGRAVTALLTAYPDVLKTTSQYEVKVGKKTIKSTNQLLRGKPYYDSRLGVDGLKTGYTGSAGYCLITTAQVPGKHRLVIVTLHSKSSADRFSGTRRLLRSIYDAYALAA